MILNPLDNLEGNPLWVQIIIWVMFVGGCIVFTKAYVGFWRETQRQIEDGTHPIMLWLQASVPTEKKDDTDDNRME